MTARFAELAAAVAAVGRAVERIEHVVDQLLGDTPPTWRNPS